MTMKKVVYFLIGAMLLSAGSVFSQCKVTKGDLSVLKGQSVVNVQFDYSNMMMGKKKTEAQYVTEKKAELNKKEAGSGDKWETAWVGDRDARFEPSFLKNFNEEVQGKGLVGKEDAADAKYTLIVRTVYTEPGYNVGVSRMDAYISLKVDLVENGAADKIIASMEMKKEPSINMMGYDYDKGGRIQSCYDRAGGHLGKCIEKYGLK